MESEFVTVNRVPLRVNCWGGYMPSRIMHEFQEKPRNLVFFICGNPGIVEYYQEFLNYVHEKTRLPIWIVSHAGHGKTRKMVPPFDSNRQLYGFRGQSNLKLKFIEIYLEGVNLYCIGHSLGCKMLLEMMKKRNSALSVEKCILLFPTLERLAFTPTRPYQKFITNFVLWLVFFGSWVFTCLPKCLQDQILRVYCYVTRLPESNIPGMKSLIQPDILKRVFFLADDEYLAAKEMDEEMLTENAHKIKIYYGAIDGWTSLQWYKKLTRKYPGIELDVCNPGYQYTFLKRHFTEVADVVCAWLTE